MIGPVPQDTVYTVTMYTDNGNGHLWSLSRLHPLSQLEDSFWLQQSFKRTVFDDPHVETEAVRTDSYSVQPVGA